LGIPVSFQVRPKNELQSLKHWSLNYANHRQILLICWKLRRRS
jgi:hypothetical protein